MREYEYSSLTDIKRYANIPWNKELFRHIFVFENYPSIERHEESEIIIENSAGNESTNFDLTFSSALMQSKLHYKIIYKNHLYDENEILRLMGMVKYLLINLTEAESISIGELVNDMKVGAK